MRYQSSGLGRQSYDILDISRRVWIWLSPVLFWKRNSLIRIIRKITKPRILKKFNACSNSGSQYTSTYCRSRTKLCTVHSVSEPELSIFGCIQPEPNFSVCSGSGSDCHENQRKNMDFNFAFGVTCLIFFAKSQAVHDLSPPRGWLHTADQI